MDCTALYSRAQSRLLDTGRLETGEDGGISDCVTMSAQHKCPFIVIKKQYKIEEL
jgi:hypothetical protein